jgi:DNA-binding transcriptional MerR regulator
MRAKVTIGEFSRAAHLSVKTLRHYHDVGLLEPREVDPDSGYRYYSEDQIPQAQVIRRLRGLQMPVAEVRSLLATEDAAVRNELIVAHLDRLEAELAETAAAADALRDLLRRPPSSPEVEHRTVLPTAAVAIEATVQRNDVITWWQGALGELEATVRAQRLTATGPSGGLFDSAIFQEDRGSAIVFIPVDGQVKAIGRVTPVVIPGAELAIIRHHGSLSTIDVAYGELGAWVMKHEISIDGPLREYYLQVDFDDLRSETWETEIGWPVFRADAEAAR